MLFTGEDDEIFDMWSVGEEVVGFDGVNIVFIKEEGNITGLGGGVAGEIDDSGWFYF